MRRTSLCDIFQLQKVYRQHGNGHHRSNTLPHKATARNFAPSRFAQPVSAIVSVYFLIDVMPVSRCYIMTKRIQVTMDCYLRITGRTGSKVHQHHIIAACSVYMCAGTQLNTLKKRPQRQNQASPQASLTRHRLQYATSPSETQVTHHLYALEHHRRVLQ